MTRLERFRALEHHAWFKRIYKKLSKTDILLAEEFLIQNESLSKDDYAMKAVRIWLGKDISERPKRWTHIEELLIASI